MIDPNQLAAWRKLCEEATPEPWEHRKANRFSDGGVDWGVRDEEGYIIAESFQVVGRNVQRPAEANVQFIAAARTALPQLLDEVEALQAELAAEYRHNHTLDESHSGLVLRVKELEAEVARLKGES